MDIIGVVKEHPVPIAIGVVILLLMVKASSNTGTASSSASSNLAYQSQQLATQSNTQIAGINSATAIALGAQSVERSKNAESSALARANVAANVFASATGATLQRDLSNDNNTNKVIMATFARSTNNDNIAASLAAQNAEINSKIRINSDNLNAQMGINAADNNFKLAQIGAQTQGSLAIISGAGTVQQNILAQNNAFTASTLPTMLQHAEQMARITGQNQLNIVTRQTEAANTAADANANQSNWGIVGNIASTLFSFL